MGGAGSTVGWLRSRLGLGLSVDSECLLGCIVERGAASVEEPAEPGLVVVVGAEGLESQVGGCYNTNCIATAKDCAVERKRKTIGT